MADLTWNLSDEIYLLLSNPTKKPDRLLAQPLGEIMSKATVNRFYDIPDRDFWDICSHFQRVRPDYQHIAYTIEGTDNSIVRDESDVGIILSRLNETEENVLRYSARFSPNNTPNSSECSSSELVYCPTSHDGRDAGLSFIGQAMTKLSLFRFEDQIYSNYVAAERQDIKIEFGRPCEVLSAVIDMRGFSAFCEQPNIESPYTCGLMSSFYHMVSSSVSKFQPEIIKFQGDGVIAIWETSVEDRQVAIDVCVEGMMSLNRKWQIIRRNPHFSHGAPEDIGVGISFGLASKLTIGIDYIGRPINIASRLCGVCPGGRIYIDKSVPSLSGEYNKRESRLRIRSFGEYNVWTIFCD